jgi:hypothetical protein
MTRLKFNSEAELLAYLEEAKRMQNQDRLAAYEEVAKRFLGQPLPDDPEALKTYVEELLGALDHAHNNCFLL